MILSNAKRCFERFSPSASGAVLVFGLLLFCFAGTARPQETAAMGFHRPVVIEYEQPGDYRSGSALGVEDQTGDGVRDVIVTTQWGDYFAALHCGATGQRVRNLAPSELAQYPDYSIKGSGYSGSLMRSIPDTNADGTADVLFLYEAWVMYEAPYTWGFEQSLVVYDGRTLEPRLTIAPPEGEDAFPGDGVGFEMVFDGLPDTNGNGTGDVAALSILRRADESEDPAYRIHLFDGGDGALLRTIRIGYDTGVSPYRIAGAPDCTGDGLGDLLFGGGSDVPEEDGKAPLYSGATGDLVDTLRSTSPTYGGLFGHRVAAMPDVTGDGLGDLLVSAPNETAYHSFTDETVYNSMARESEYGAYLQAGRVYVFSGADRKPVQTIENPNLLTVTELDRQNLQFGYGEMAVLPDITGNGAPDLAVGASDHGSGEDGGLASGRVYVFEGESWDLVETLQSPYESNYKGFGSYVAGLSPSTALADSGGVIIGESSTDAVYVYRFARPSPMREMVTAFYSQALNREPEQGAVNAWVFGLFNQSVRLGADVRLVARQMGRQFLLSEEYAARNRSREDFLTDCYRIFLDRDPGQTELDGWLAGEWARETAVSILARSAEFAARVEALYAGLSGEWSRNLVAEAYVGLLDRLPETDGMEYGASLFESEAPADALVTLVVGILGSEEFQAIGYAPDALADRLYRAVLGRLSAPDEARYWGGQYETGAMSAEELLILLAASPECAARLSSGAP